MVHGAGELYQLFVARLDRHKQRPSKRTSAPTHKIQGDGSGSSPRRGAVDRAEGYRLDISQSPSSEASLTSG